MYGLSPRVRGNRSCDGTLSPRRGNRLQQHGELVRGSTRSIPACAGEPCMASASEGLSPRVRGTSTHLIAESSGSIPACAGEPSTSKRSHIASPLFCVYPRVCGGTKNKGPAIIRSQVYPRVCGGTAWDYAQPRVPLQNGSIPACAGEPIHPCHAGKMGLSPRVRGNLVIIQALMVSINPTVYPRVCGGTRERRSTRKHCLLTTRSIPACAGEPTF